MTVRFLTRRFISEYAGGIDSAYVHTFNIQGRSIDMKIIDKGEKVSYLFLTSDHAREVRNKLLEVHLDQLAILTTKLVYQAGSGWAKILITINKVFFGPPSMDSIHQMK